MVQGRGSRLAREEPSPLGSCWGRKKWDRGKGEVVLQLGVEGSCENISITLVPRWGTPMSMFWCLGRQQSVAASCSIPSWATSSLHCITKHTYKCFFFFFFQTTWPPSPYLHRMSCLCLPTRQQPRTSKELLGPHASCSPGSLQPSGTGWRCPGTGCLALATLRPCDLRKDWL